MVTLKNSDEFRAWLNALPKDIRRDVAVVMAARCALRVFPFSYQLYHSNSFYKTLLKLFYGLATALSASAWPYKTVDVGIAPRIIARITAQSPDDVVLATYTATDAAYAAYANLDSSINDATDTAIEAIEIALKVRPNIVTWRILSLDATFIENNNTTASLAQQALWQDSIPESAKRAWTELEKLYVFPEENLSPQYWYVWIDWYEARLHGAPLNADYELARLDMLIRHWDNNKLSDPAAANKEIADLDLWPPPPDDHIPDPPAQTQLAATFGQADDGRIASTTPSDGRHLEDEPAIRDFYEEYRTAIDELSQQSPNSLGDVKTPIEKVLQALPENMAEAIIPILWSRSNALRKRLDRHKAALGDPDNVFDKLDTAIAAQLKNAVEVFNNLVFNSDGLSQCDDRALGPISPEQALEEMALIEPIIDSFIEADLTTEELAGWQTEIKTQNESTGDGRYDLRQTLFNHESYKNFLAFSWKLVKTVSTVGGAVIVSAAGGALYTYLSTNQAIINVARQIWPHLF